MLARFFFATLLSSSVLATGATPVQDKQTCASLWGQCGGEKWTGPTCCTAGSTCERQDRWFSQCLANGSLYPSYSFADEQKFRELSFKWTTAWDLKDKTTFLAITAPIITSDYTDYPAVGTLTVANPADIFDNGFGITGLGDKRLQTQHFLGSSFFTRINETAAKGDWQVRARHVRDFHNGTVHLWDSSAFVEFTYVIVEDGSWKIGGMRPHTVVATLGQSQDVIGLFEY